MQIFSNRLLLLVVSVGILSSCLIRKAYYGTVLSTEQGKDGYTAYLVNKNGEKFDAVLSIPRMEENFKLLKAGDRVRLEGDTIHLGQRVRVLVKKIH